MRTPTPGTDETKSSSSHPASHPDVEQAARGGRARSKPSWACRCEWDGMHVRVNFLEAVYPTEDGFL